VQDWCAVDGNFDILTPGEAYRLDGVLTAGRFLGTFAEHNRRALFSVETFAPESASLTFPEVERVVNSRGHEVQVRVRAPRRQITL